MEEIVIVPPSGQKTLEWITALSAEGLDYRLERDGRDWVLYLPEALSDRARETIEGYEQDNIDWPPRPAVESKIDRFIYDNWTGFGIAAVLVVFYLWLGPFNAKIPVHAAADAHAEAIQQGEWWRVFTALTLHAGFAHLAGNVVFLGLFGYLVCRRLGGGIGAFLLLASGAAANTTVAWLSQYPHHAVGASTAGFGALGIYAVCEAVVRFRESGNWRSVWSRAWIPLGGAAALLSLMGTSPGSDLAGHLFGFLFGVLLAIPAAWFGTRKLPEAFQRLLELVCLLLVLGAWRVAFEMAGRLTP